MTKTDDRAIKWLATALQMEEKGEEFYKKAMDECKNKPGKEIWKMLRKDEIVHKSRIKKLYDSLKDGKGWKKSAIGKQADTKKLRTFFNGVQKKHASDIKAETDDIKAMDVGIDFELKAIKFYEKNLTKAKDPVEKNFLNMMIKEERSHYTALSDMKLYLIDPVGWFRDKERTHLDGLT